MYVVPVRHEHVVPLQVCLGIKSRKDGEIGGDPSQELSTTYADFKVIQVAHRESTVAESRNARAVPDTVAESDMP